jgi:MFS family permease
MPDVSMRDWLMVLGATAAWTFVRAWTSSGTVGLVFTYVFSFTALYWLAPLMYMLPWYDTRGHELTALGLREAALAMAAFAVGTEIARPIARRLADRLPVEERLAPIDTRLTNLLLLTGAALYVVVFPIAGYLPSMTAFVSTGSMVAVVALSLKCWSAFHGGREPSMWTWLAATTALPLITVLGQGFLGYGFAAMMTILAFVASFYRPRSVVVVAGVLLMYLGLSVYVTYMRDRRDIRAVVWAGSGMSQRVGQIADTFATIEWFDPRDVRHLDRIDLRLNQDYLMGASVAYFAGGSAEFAHGRTVWDAVIALVPRALWPNKPAVAGSGNLVSDYTGIRFAEGTSVGIGQLMEAYVNFGRTGVLVCFLILGIVVATVDSAAYARLARGEGAEFLVRYLPALSLLQLGGSFAEVTSSGAAALVVALLIRRFTRALPDRRRRQRADASEHPVTAAEVRRT